MADPTPSNSRFIAVEIDGAVTVHLPGIGGDYATLCGLDGTDEHPAVGQRLVDVPAGARCNCRRCIAIYDLARQYGAADIDRRAAQ